MLDIKSLLIVSTTLAVGGLGLYLYKSESEDNYDQYDDESGDEDDHYDNDSVNDKLQISDKEEMNMDHFYELEKPKILKSKKQKTKRSKRKSHGTRRKF
jgi:hypothetical protein